MGDSDVVTDGSENDSRNDEHDDVRVGASPAAGIGCAFERSGYALADAVEGDPPHRDDASEGESECGKPCRAKRSISKCRSAHDDGFAERDNDELLVALV